MTAAGLRSLLWAVPLLLTGAPPASAESCDPPLHQLFPTHRGRIGVEIQSLTPELREHMKAPPDRGVLVARVEPRSAGDRAGAQVGDVIVAANGEPVRRPFDLVKRVARVPEGGSLELEIVRDGKKRTLSVEPEGSATPWVDPEHWGEWIERGMRRGSESLRDRLEALERRLEELERRLEEGRGDSLGQET